MSALVLTFPRRWVWAALLGAISVSAPARADILLSDGFHSYRFGEDGALRRTSSGFYGQEGVDTHVLSSNRKIFYQLAESFGENYTIPYSAETGSALVTTVPGGGGYPLITGITGGAVNFNFGTRSDDNAVHRGRAPRLHVNSLANREELFVVSQPFLGTTPTNIKRFNGVTGAFVQSLAAPAAGPTITDFAFGLFNRLYAATDAGIYVYQANPSGTFLAPQLLIPGVTGQVAVRPSPSLLINEGNTINRYNEITGTFIGNFLRAADLGSDEFRAIEFDNDGTLYVLHTKNPPPPFTFPDAFVSKVNGVTGQVLSTVSVPKNGYTPDMFILPVPEPAAGTLAALGLAILARRRRE